MEKCFSLLKARMVTTPLVVSPSVEKRGDRASATCFRAASALLREGGERSAVHVMSQGPLVRQNSPDVETADEEEDGRDESGGEKEDGEDDRDNDSDEEHLDRVVEHRLEVLHLLGIEDLRVLAEAIEEGSMRRDVEETEGSAKDRLCEALVELARCLDGAEDEREVHGGEGDGGSELNAGVDGEIEGGVRVPVACVDPSTDPPALRETSESD